MAAPVAAEPDETKERRFVTQTAEETNSYHWEFDLCSVTLGNFHYRKMSLVRDYTTLLDRTDTDGKRLVVAKRNAPKVAAPLPLDAREKQVVMLAGQGYSTANIAYVLGMSPALVTSLVDGALPKLGLGVRAELSPLVDEWLAPPPKARSGRPKK